MYNKDFIRNKVQDFIGNLTDKRVGSFKITFNQLVNVIFKNTASLQWDFCLIQRLSC